MPQDSLFLHICCFLCVNVFNSRMYIVINCQKIIPFYKIIFKKKSFFGAGCPTSSNDSSIPSRRYSGTCINSTGQCSLFRCDLGYILVGNGATWCMNGNWDPPVGTCVLNPWCE